MIQEELTKLADEEDDADAEKDEKQVAQEVETWIKCLTKQCGMPSKSVCCKEEKRGEEKATVIYLLVYHYHVFTANEKLSVLLETKLVVNYS